MADSGDPAFDAFWLEWASRRARFQDSCHQFLDSQETLVRNFLEEKHSAKDDKNPYRAAFAAGKKSACTWSSSQLGSCSIVSSGIGNRVSQQKPIGAGDVTLEGGGTPPPRSSHVSVALAEKSSNSGDKSTDFAEKAPGEKGSVQDWKHRYEQLKIADLKVQRRDKFLENACIHPAQFLENAAADALPTVVHRALHWWVTLEEPLREGWLHDIVRHKAFDIAVSVVIVVNALYTAWQCNYEMDHKGAQMPGQGSFEAVFLAIYLAELSLKMRVHGPYFFCNQDMCWNLFDFIIVAEALVDTLMTVVDNPQEGNFTFARSLRVFKVGRILRVFRTMRFLKSLRVIMSSIMGSFVSLMWSFLMIGMILYVFALFFIQQMTVQLYDPRNEANVDTELWSAQRHYFRNVERTVLTLLESTMGGIDWDDVYVLIEPMGLVYISAYIFYIAFFTFAVMNILTGIFVDNAMKLCRPDDEELIIEQRLQDADDIKELHRIVGAMDLDKTGMISREQFVALAQEEKIMRCFTTLGIDIKQPELFFRTVAGPDSSTQMTIEAFVLRAVHMKGMATSTDLQSLIFQTGLIQQRLHKLLQKQRETTPAQWRPWRREGASGQAQDACDDTCDDTCDHRTDDWERRPEKPQPTSAPTAASLFSIGCWPRFL